MPSDEEKCSLSSATFIACRDVQSQKAKSLISITESGMSMEVMVLSFIPKRIVTVSSRIRFGSIMVIMDFVFAKIMKKNRTIIDGGLLYKDKK